MRLIELTQVLSERAPSWGGSCGFCAEVKKDYDRMFRVQKVQMHAGIGTHMDAPSHRFSGAASIGEIPLEELIVPVYVMDVRSKADAHYEISCEDILEFEAQWGEIAPETLFIGFTGWSRFWTDVESYRNVDERGQMCFPAFSRDAAALLLERGVVGIGIDTLSPDCSNSDYPVHRIFLGANKYIIENIGDCSLMPPKGAFAIALPLRALGLTECPIRLVGVIDASF